jgi:hypothetical protein
MDAPRDAKPADDRRTPVRRTVWTLAIIAGAIYGYFIVKTFLHHTGGAA